MGRTAGSRFGFGTGYAPAASNRIVEILAAPEGGWSGGLQVAAYYNGSTYIAFVRGTDGDLRIFSVDDATLTASARTVIHDNLDVDLHATPSVLVRDSDKRIMVAYSAHNSSALWLWTSTNPEDISAGSRVNLDSTLGGTQYTYAHLIQLTGLANDPIYLFYRPHPGGHPGHTNQKWAYSVSTDDGATWSAGVNFYGGDPSGYLVPSRTSDSRIDFGATDGAPQGAAFADISAYHFYFDGTDFYQTDGTQITATQPFDQTAITQVFDATVDSVGCNPSSAALGGDGHPRMVFAVIRAAQDIETWWARWTGSAWDAHMVADGQWSGADNLNRGGSDIDPADPNRVYHTKRVSGQTELFISETSDNGSTWSTAAITTSSASKQLKPHVPTNAGPAIGVVWTFGTFTSDTSYSLGTRGGVP